MVMTLRKTRALVARVTAKTKPTTPRIARTAHLDRRGLTLDGNLLPYYLGLGVEVTHLGNKTNAIRVSIFAEKFTHGTLPHGARLTLIEDSAG